MDKLVSLSPSPSPPSTPSPLRGNGANIWTQEAKATNSAIEAKRTKGAELYQALLRLDEKIEEVNQRRMEVLEWANQTADRYKVARGNATNRRHLRMIYDQERANLDAISDRV